MSRRTISSAINYAGSGDNTIVPSSTTSPIHVWGIMFTVAGATNIIFKSGTTALTGAMVFTGNGSSMTLQINMDEPYFSCPTGNAFIMNASLAVQTSGVLYYTTG